jgi:hypothetical protein
MTRKNSPFFKGGIKTGSTESPFSKGGIKGGLKRGKDEKQKSFECRFVVITAPGLCFLLWRQL